MDEKDLEIDKSLFKQQLLARERINKEKNNPLNWSNPERLKQISEAEKALQDDIQVILTAHKQRQKMSGFQMPQEEAPAKELAPEVQKVSEVKQPVKKETKAAEITIPKVTPLVQQRIGKMQNGQKVLQETFKTDEMLGVEKGSTLAHLMLESSLNPKAFVQKTKAKGLAQIIPATLSAWEKRTKRKYNPFNPLDAVILNRLTMQENMKLANNDYDEALRIYFGGTEKKNWGPKTEAYPQLVKDRLSQVVQTQVATTSKSKGGNRG